MCITLTCCGGRTTSPHVHHTNLLCPQEPHHHMSITITCCGGRTTSPHVRRMCALSPSLYKPGKGQVHHKSVCCIGQSIAYIILFTSFHVVWKLNYSDKLCKNLIILTSSLMPIILVAPSEKMIQVRQSISAHLCISTIWRNSGGESAKFESNYPAWVAFCKVCWIST